jgi:hypothetical protein
MSESIRGITVLVVDDNGILYQSLACGQSGVKDHQPTLTASTIDMMAAAANRAVHGLSF